MSRRDYRTLIDRGRKAGLGTSDLYRAMAAQPSGTPLTPGQSDSNGFVPRYDEQGQRIFRPIESLPGS